MLSIITYSPLHKRNKTDFFFIFQCVFVFHAITKEPFMNQSLAFAYISNEIINEYIQTLLEQERCAQTAKSIAGI